MMPINIEDQTRCERESPLPLTASTPLFAEYVDDYVLTKAGWKIQHRKIVIVFRP